MYVGEGTLDVGISGRDLVLDSHADADTIMELGFGGSTFRFAGRPGVAESVKDLQASGSPPRSPGSSATTWPRTASTRPSSGWTARSSPRSSSASRT